MDAVEVVSPSDSWDSSACTSTASGSPPPPSHSGLPSSVKADTTQNTSFHLCVAVWGLNSIECYKSYNNVEAKQM